MPGTLSAEIPWQQVDEDTPSLFGEAAGWLGVAGLLVVGGGLGLYAWGRASLEKTAEIVFQQQVRALSRQAGYEGRLGSVQVDWNGALRLKDLHLSRHGQPVVELDEVQIALDTGALLKMWRGEPGQPVKKLLLQGGQVHLHQRADGSLLLPGLKRPTHQQAASQWPLLQMSDVRLSVHAPLRARPWQVTVDYADVVQHPGNRLAADLSFHNPWVGEAEAKLNLNLDTWALSSKGWAKGLRLDPLLNDLNLTPAHPDYRGLVAMAAGGTFEVAYDPGKPVAYDLSLDNAWGRLRTAYGSVICENKKVRFDGHTFSTSPGSCLGGTLGLSRAFGAVAELTEASHLPVVCRHQGARVDLHPTGPEIDLSSLRCNQGISLDMRLQKAHFKDGLLALKGQAKFPAAFGFTNVPRGDFSTWIYGENPVVELRETLRFEGAYRPSLRMFHANVSRVGKGFPRMGLVAHGRLQKSAVKLSGFTANLRGQKVFGRAVLDATEGRVFVSVAGPEQPLSGEAKGLMGAFLSKDETALLPPRLGRFQGAFFSRVGGARASLSMAPAAVHYQGVSAMARGAVEVQFPPKEKPVYRARATVVPKQGGRFDVAVFSARQTPVLATVGRGLTPHQAVQAGFVKSLPDELKGGVFSVAAVGVKNRLRGVMVGKVFWGDFGQTRLLAQGQQEDGLWRLPTVLALHRETFFQGDLLVDPQKRAIQGQFHAPAASYDALPLSASALDGLAYFPLISSLQVQVSGPIEEPQVLASGHAQGVWGQVGQLRTPTFQGPMALVENPGEENASLNWIGQTSWFPRTPFEASTNVVEASVSWRVAYARGAALVQGETRLENPTKGVNEGVFTLAVNSAGELAGVLSASVGDLTLLAPQIAATSLGGILQSRGEISGTLDDPLLRLSLRDVAGLKIAPGRTARLRGSLSLNEQGATLEGLTLREGKGSAELGGFWAFDPAGERHLDLTLRAMDLALVVAAAPVFSATPLPPGVGALSGVAGGRLSYQQNGSPATLTGSVEAPDLRLRGEPLGAFQLALEGVGDTLHLREFSLSGSRLLVRAEGALSESFGTLRWTFENVPLSLVATALSLSAPLSGEVGGEMLVETRENEDTQLNLRASLDTPVAGLLTADAGEVSVSVTGQRATLHTLRLKRGRGELSITGEAPLDRHGQLSLSVSLEDADLAQWVSALPPELSMSLPAHGQVTITGTPAQPVLAGVVDFDQPMVSVTGGDWPLVEGGHARALFTPSPAPGKDILPGQIVLSGEVERKGARATVAGEASLGALLRPKPGLVFLSASLSAENAPLDIPDLFQGHGTLRILAQGLTGPGGTAQKLRFTGTVNLARDAVLFMQPYDRAVAASQGLSAMEYDVLLNTHPAGMEIRGPARTLSMAVSGASRVASAHGPPSLLGQMTLQHGELLLLNNRFVMEKGGLLHFKPITGLWPEVDIKARARVRGRDISVALKGPLNEIQLPDTGDTPPGVEPPTATALFTASPPMDQKEILALLLRRDLVEGALETGDFSAALRNQLGEVAGVYTSALFSQQGRALGFESLDVTLTENNDLFLLVEREVKNDFLLHYEQKFDQEQSRLMSVKWRFSPGSYLTTAVDHESETSLFLEQRRSLDF